MTTIGAHASAAALALALQAAPSPAPPAGETVIDVRGVRPPAVASFEGVWGAYQAARAAGDSEGAQKQLAEIRRLRTERNVRSLSTFALARVAEGLDALGQGEVDAAEEDFRDAVVLDPHLPDGHLGLTVVATRRGPSGFLTALRHHVHAQLARLATWHGRLALLSLLYPAALAGWFGALLFVAVALLFRHGPLLLHDVDEILGPRNPRVVAVAAFAIVLALPVVLLQGWGWLPLWWLALVFLYMSRLERAVSAVLVLALLSVGPLAASLEQRLATRQNPLFRSSLQATEGGPDALAAAELEQALRDNPDDRDYAYLLGRQLKMAGRYDEAAALYRRLLAENATDPVGLNNLANIELAQGELPAAIGRYKQGIDSGPPAPVAAVLNYNLSTAHLQKVEFEPGQQARAEADRLDKDLIRSYEASWKYDTGTNAPVDLGLTTEQVEGKFAGVPEGPGRKNVFGQRASAASGGAFSAAVNRLLAFLVVFGACVFVLQRLRGPKMFTSRCQKCGAAYCTRCQLGAATAGICTQCYHLFVVRDGVSAPARTQKLQEVQKEEAARGRTFRLLSLLLPGAGHVFAHRTVAGTVVAALWCSVIAVAVVGGRLLPLTDASPALGRPWGLGLAALVLLVLYVVVNRARPAFESALPAPARRGQTQARRPRPS